MAQSPRKKRSFDKCLSSDAISPDSASGSPMITGVPHPICGTSEDAIRDAIDDYLDEVAIALTGKGYVSVAPEVQRFFLGAVIRKDDEDPGSVHFAFVGAQILSIVIHEYDAGRNPKHLHIAALDADNLVPSICSFLQPFGLDKVHHWIIDLEEQMQVYLIDRVAYVYGEEYAVAARRLRTNLLQATLGIPTVVKVAVWSTRK